MTEAELLGSGLHREITGRKPTFDAEPAEKAMETVRHFYKVSQEGGQRRISLVTGRYLDYCRAHGYNGVDVGQKVSFSDSFVLPYQGYQMVDMEQITRKSFMCTAKMMMWFSASTDAWLYRQRTVGRLTK